MHLSFQLPNSTVGSSYRYGYGMQYCEALNLQLRGRAALTLVLPIPTRQEQELHAMGTGQDLYVGASSGYPVGLNGEHGVEMTRGRSGS